MECVELRGICDSFILGGAAGQPTNQLRACAYWFLAKNDSCKVVGGPRILRWVPMRLHMTSYE